MVIVKYILFAFLTTCYLNSTGQKISKSKNDLFDSKEIIFYGYDFSHFKLAEAKRLNSEPIKVYLPAWVGFFNKDIDEDYLKKQLKKERVIFDFEYTTNIIKNIDKDDLVSITKNSISADSIQSIIINYQIKEQEGIGFVVIVECFEKASRKSSAYFVFFDIATKNIIISDYFESINSLGGTGLTRFWGIGFTITFKNYLTEVYRKKRKGKLE